MCFYFKRRNRKESTKINYINKERGWGCKKDLLIEFFIIFFFFAIFRFFVLESDLFMAINFSRSI